MRRVSDAGWMKLVCAEYEEEDGNELAQWMDSTTSSSLIGCLFKPGWCIGGSARQAESRRGWDILVE